MRILHRLLVFVLAIECAACATAADAQARRAGGSPAPPAARAASYTLNTFHLIDINSSQIDFGQTLVSGKKLYFWNLFGCQATDSEATLRGDGTVRVTGHCGPGGTLMSGVVKAGSPGYVGTAFGGGGYFEAEIAYNPAAVKISDGWPAWWTMAAEHLWALPGSGSRQAAFGQVPYEHFIEADLFEALVPPPRHVRSYLASVHEWYGAFDKTCKHFCSYSTPYAVNVKSAPPGHDWSTWHKVAMLWVPATATAPGSLTFYLDDVQQGVPLEWAQYDTNKVSPPVEPTASWRFGVIDGQHLVLIFGAGRGTPLHVRSVNVWQASAANNVSH